MSLYVLGRGWLPGRATPGCPLETHRSSSASSSRPDDSCQDPFPAAPIGLPHDLNRRRQIQRGPTEGYLVTQTWDGINTFDKALIQRALTRCRAVCMYLYTYISSCVYICCPFLLLVMTNVYVSFAITNASSSVRCQ